MRVFIVLENNPSGFSKVLGVYTTLKEAEEKATKNWSCWANEPRTIIGTFVNDSKEK